MKNILEIRNLSHAYDQNTLTIKDLRSDKGDRSISFDDFSKFIEEY